MDTIDKAMEAYKGGTPNHSVGQKVRKLPFQLDESLQTDEIALPKEVMAQLSANKGDMIYMEDSRWYLGGLRSNHVKAITSQSNKLVVSMSTSTMNNAYLEDHRMVTLEKIF